MPLIFLTARWRGLDEVLGLQLGVDAYIAKPFDKNVLLARIKTSCDVLHKPKRQSRSRKRKRPWL